MSHRLVYLNKFQTHLVSFVFIGSNSLEDSGNLFSRVIVNYPQHTGGNGAVELGHNQHGLLNIQHIPKETQQTVCEDISKEKSLKKSQII